MAENTSQTDALKVVCKEEEFPAADNSGIPGEGDTLVHHMHGDGATL